MGEVEHEKAEVVPEEKPEGEAKEAEVKGEVESVKEDIPEKKEKDVPEKKEKKPKGRGKAKKAAEEPEAKKEENGELKTPKRQKKEPKEGTPSEPTRSSVREKKKVERFVVAKPDDEDKDLEVPNGAGTPLGDIENINSKLASVTGAMPFLRKLHSVVYPGQRLKKISVKKNLKLFKGFDKKADKDALSKTVVQKLEATEVKSLKLMAELLDLETGGTKTALAERVADFLFEPKSSGKPLKQMSGVKSSTKSSKSSKSSKKKGGKRKEKDPSKKRPLTSYMLFVGEKRAQVDKEHPDLSMTEKTKILGKMWKDLSEKEKQKYKDKSEKEKEKQGSSGKSSKSPKKAKRSKKASEDEGEDDGTESEDDDKPLKKGSDKSEEVKAKLKAAIVEIIKKGDLETLSIKKIREQLESDFGADAVEKHKKLIKESVNAEAAKL